jgi:hypothetical protein
LVRNNQTRIQGVNRTCEEKGCPAKFGSPSIDVIRSELASLEVLNAPEKPLGQGPHVPTTIAGE